MTAIKTHSAQVDRREAPSRILLVCEHATNHMPAPWAGLGLSEAERLAHIAWDPGALALSRGLAQRLGASLVHAPVSRLIYDLNRPPHSPGAMPERSEIYDIPGNLGISPEERARRTAAIYTPFHADLAALIAERIALGREPVVVTIHSFTPIYHGQRREVEFGIIHDDTRPSDSRYAKAILAEAGAQTKLVARLNDPYAAADGVTHLLRRQAVPFGLDHAMLELRNDLIATEEQADLMAATLAPVLQAALTRIEGEM